MNKRTILIIVAAIVLIALTVMKLLSNKEKAAAKIYIHDTEAAILVEAANPSTHRFESEFSFLEPLIRSARI